MGVSLDFYSKKRVENTFKGPISEFLTDDGFYKSNVYGDTSIAIAILVSGG